MYFDQGLAFTYGFNHDEAERSFEQAAQIDPKIAIAYWGIALVLGPNYNLPGDPARSKKAYDAVARARALESGASPEERALIDAVAQRYGTNGEGSKSSDQAYANAMRTVAHKYPDDLDVQTLFAESLVDLHPWRLWSIDGKPGPDTIEIVTTLEKVLKKDPNNIGATITTSMRSRRRPIRARDGKRRPARRAGARRRPFGAHALAHLYPHRALPRCGRGQRERDQGDQAFFAKSKEGGVYPLVYYTHNIHFLCYAQMIEGRQHDALASARVLERCRCTQCARCRWLSFWSRCRTWSRRASACGIRF